MDDRYFFGRGGKIQIGKATPLWCTPQP